MQAGSFKMTDFNNNNQNQKESKAKDKNIYKIEGLF